MCGIVGYIGNREKKRFLIDGLKELEYRGYDSAGIAMMGKDRVFSFKAVGKLDNLEKKAKDVSIEEFGVGIGHTRWATYGKPTELNAHPHWGKHAYIVHNGIIENYELIKKKVLANGANFLSQTDTESIVHLFELNFQVEKDPFKAFKKTIDELNGSYAILLITSHAPNTIFFAKNAVPLIVGKNDNNESFFSSSDAPLIGEAKEVAYLNDGDVGFVNEKEMVVFNWGKESSFNFGLLTQDKIVAQKEGYRFFMEKEIYEQSTVFNETMIGRVKNDSIYFDELDNNFLEGIKEIRICACGTSYHAGLVASYLLERIAKVRTTVEIASEFRHKEPLLTKETLFVTISQSGETADTLEALKEVKEKGLKTLAICNVDNSSIVRTSDATILTRAGIEKGVASTKAFATQVACLWMFALYVAKCKKTISEEYLKEETKALLAVPKVLKVKDGLHDKIHRLSKRYLHGHGFFFIGRDLFYPLALEGALKLKEISYLHAEGYPAGEMKHGPIALADSELFTIALMPQTMLYDKVKSNVGELSARDATILAISPIHFDLADDFIKTGDYSHPMHEFFEMMLVMQILALEISIRLGNDVDMPRNLAKSVTVE